MNILRNFYYKFKQDNPDNPGIKLGIVLIILIYILSRGVSNFKFSWEMLIGICIFIMSMTLHEVAHGYAAYRFGDDTAKNYGRITLNPLKHIDLKGMLIPLMLLLAGSPFLIGMAKPVPVNFGRLKPNRLGMFCVAVAGIVVNLILAAIAVTVLQFFPVEDKLNALIGDGNLLIFAIMYLYFVNLLLAFFNLIPITPLDGGRIVSSLSGEKVRKFYEKIEPYGIIIVFLIFYIASELPASFTVFEKIFVFFAKIAAGVEVSF